MPYYINLIDDPNAKEPQIVERIKRDGLLHFRSFPFDGKPAQEFKLEFTPAFENKYSRSAGFTKGVIANGKVTFTAKKIPGGAEKFLNKAEKILNKTKKIPNDSYEARIKLKSSTGHPGHGYKYNIVMNGKTLDPRVIPD